MNEDFVSFDLAKKLKEKGFPQYTEKSYFVGDHKKRMCSVGTFLHVHTQNTEHLIAAPTISQVLKWLREEKCISVEPYASASGWRVAICRAYCQDRCDAGGGTCLKEEVIGYNDGGAFEKYEEAAIAGIEYVIDNSI